MTALIKTIEILSIFLGSVPQSVFNDETYGTKVATNTLLIRRKIILIILAVCILSGIGISVTYVHSIVADQYAIAVLTKEIQTVEREHQTLLSRYAEIQLLQSVNEENLVSSGFQNINLLRFVGHISILQANAAPAR